MRHVKRQYTKLIFEMKFLYADLEYHEVIFEESKEAFNKGLKDFMRRHNIKGNIQDYQNKNQPEETKIKVKSEMDLNAEDYYNEPLKESKITDKELSKLFKEIAVQTHPDKLSKDMSPQEKSKKIDMFLKAKKAAEEDDWFKLQEVAMDLGLNLPPPTQNQLKLLKEKIQDIKAKIHKMSDTYAWKWYDMETIESKDQLMKHYMKIAFGIQIPF
jgi:hypothetical protein